MDGLNSITYTGKQIYDTLTEFPKIGVMTKTRQGTVQQNTAQQNTVQHNTAQQHNTYTLYNSDCIQWSWNPNDTVYEIAIGDTTVNGTLFELEDIGNTDSPYQTYTLTSDTMEDTVTIGFIEK